MVWVWPPHTSMSLYCRPGSHSATILAASACALSASRNSSTNRIVRPSYSISDCRSAAIVLVGLPDPLEEFQGRRRLGFVDLRQGEANMDQHPLTRLRRIVGEQADVDQPPHAAHVHLGEVGLLWVEFDYLTRYAQAHATPPACCRRLQRRLSC